MTGSAGSTRYLTSPPTLRWSTDYVVFHAPASPHPLGAGFHARPAWVDGQRYCIAPTLHQPLSHAASRRDSSPFRGAKGWAEVCGACASVSHDADTYVSHPPVRGGVLDAPPLRDCRGGVVADGRRDQLHPCLPQRTRLRPSPHVLYPAGTARAPLARRAGPTSSVIRRKGRRGRRLLRWVRDIR